MTASNALPRRSPQSLSPRYHAAPTFSPVPALGPPYYETNPFCGPVQIADDTGLHNPSPTFPSTKRTHFGSGSLLSPQCLRPSLRLFAKRTHFPDNATLRKVSSDAGRGVFSILLIHHSFLAKGRAPHPPTSRWADTGPGRSRAQGRRRAGAAPATDGRRPCRRCARARERAAARHRRSHSPDCARCTAPPRTILPGIPQSPQAPPHGGFRRGDRESV